jgi:hypothetical protein
MVGAATPNAHTFANQSPFTLAREGIGVFARTALTRRASRWGHAATRPLVVVSDDRAPKRG